MTPAYTSVSLLMCAALVLAACAQPEPTDQVAPAARPDQSFEAPTGVKHWEPGVYLPEHCAEVFAGAASVFEDLISEADAVECLAPYTAHISMGAEVVTAEATGESVYGVSQYLRVYRLLDTVPTIGQFGQWGQWIRSRAHHAGPFNSIEGGLFVADKMGRSLYPKYMASAATHLYSPDSDTGGGWGFYERRISCDVLGRITLSNRMVVPPHLISFDEDQDPHMDTGGIVVGTSWVALPLIDGATRNDATGETDGLLTWTFVIDADNYSGPVIAYAPQHWNLRMSRWNALEMLNDVFGWVPGETLADPAGAALVEHVEGEISEEELLPLISNEQWYIDWWADPSKTLGVAPADRYIPTGIEMPPVPVFALEEGGRTFVKVFPPQAPSLLDAEPLALNIQTFDSQVYNRFVDTFAAESDVSAWSETFEGAGFPSQVERNMERAPLISFNNLDERGEDYYENSNIDFTIPLLAYTEAEETNIIFDWSQTPQGDREIATYFELINDALVPLQEADVPEKLTFMKYGNLESPANLRNHDSELNLDIWPEEFDYDYEDTFSTQCWACDNPEGCDPEIHETTLDDGSVVRYRWYRFTDQPVFWNLKNEFPEVYTPEKLDQLQATIETMHREWGGSTNLLERPSSQSVLELAEIDHGLVLTPPSGKEVGWVPIVWEVEHPDGEWIDDVATPEIDGVPYPRR